MEEKLPVGVGAEGRNLAEGRKLDNRRIPPRAEEVWVKGHGDVAGGGRGICPREVTRLPLSAVR